MVQLQFGVIKLLVCRWLFKGTMPRKSQWVFNFGLVLFGCLFCQRDWRTRVPGRALSVHHGLMGHDGFHFSVSLLELVPTLIGGSKGTLKDNHKEDHQWLLFLLVLNQNHKESHQCGVSHSYRGKPQRKGYKSFGSEGNCHFGRASGPLFSSEASHC